MAVRDMRLLLMVAVAVTTVALAMAATTVAAVVGMGTVMAVVSEAQWRWRRH